MPVFVVGNLVLNGVDQIEATCEFESGYGTNICVTVKIEFDPEEMLE
jgi:uncharacterized protein YebE (UPF0316 family)